MLHGVPSSIGEGKVSKQIRIHPPPREMILLLHIEQFFFYLLYLFINEIKSHVSKLGRLDERPETSRQVAGPVVGYSSKMTPSKRWRAASRCRALHARGERSRERSGVAVLSIPPVSGKFSCGPDQLMSLSHLLSEKVACGRMFLAASNRNSTSYCLDEHIYYFVTGGLEVGR